MKEKLASTKGKLKKGATEYTVTCAGECGNDHIAHLYNQKQVIDELHHHSWEKVKGKWYCWLCVWKVRKP